ncbi:MAG: hypothetical protein JW798_04995 [Prolixibacteraceae bacterium]|nr:hypothetical protein [Prolixibacteraceae bacterium]
MSEIIKIQQQTLFPILNLRNKVHPLTTNLILPPNGVDGLNKVGAGSLPGVTKVALIK